MATKQLLICDKCMHEAPDPSSTGYGPPVIPSPMDRNFPTLDTSWWRFVAMIYGVAFPIDLCPTCAKSVLDFLDIEPRPPGEAISPAAGELSMDDLRRLGLVESKD